MFQAVSYDAVHGRHGPCNNGPLEVLLDTWSDLWTGISSVLQWIPFVISGNLQTCSSSALNVLNDINPRDLNRCGNTTQIAHFVGPSNDLEQLRLQFWSYVATLRSSVQDWLDLVPQIFSTVLNSSECRQQAGNVFSTALQSVIGNCTS